MRSPTYALLWEIWRRHRFTVLVIVGLTAAGRILDLSRAAAAALQMLGRGVLDVRADVLEMGTRPNRDWRAIRRRLRARRAQRARR